MSVHDEHYRKIESRGVEPIEVQETIICNDIPPEYHAIVKRNFNLAQANKYMMRCGEKDDPAKELAKAQNYIHRAIHGCWSWQTKEPNEGLSIVTTDAFGNRLTKEQIAKTLSGNPPHPIKSWAMDTTTTPE